MRVLSFTSRSKAILTLPSTSSRCFSTLCRKRNQLSFVSYFVLHLSSTFAQSSRSLSSLATASLTRSSSGFAASRCLSSMSSSAANFVELDDVVSDQRSVAE